MKGGYGVPAIQEKVELMAMRVSARMNSLVARQIFTISLLFGFLLGCVSPAEAGGAVSGIPSNIGNVSGDSNFDSGGLGLIQENYDNRVGRPHEGPEYFQPGPNGTNQAVKSGPVKTLPSVWPMPTGPGEFSFDKAYNAKLYQASCPTCPAAGLPVSGAMASAATYSALNTAVDNALSPSNLMHAVTAGGQIAATSMANSMAGAASDQAQSAIGFVQQFLVNFTADPISPFQLLRNQLFVPMAILLLLPGAVLAQAKAMVAQGSPILGEISPFEGLTRSLIAAFLIPASLLVINYGIDVSNSITFTINAQYLLLFGGDMYQDAINAENRALPVRQPQTNKNYIPPDNGQSQAQSALAQASPDPETKFESMADPKTTADEQETSDMTTNRLAMNGANAALAMTWNIMCAFQMAYLYYLWCMGPIAAALWVWPMERLRSAFPSWVEGVITLCFWSLFWNTVVLLMACFNGIGDTGAVIMTALNGLATLCVQFAFDFSSLISYGAASQLAGSVAQAMQGATGGGGAQGSGGGARSASGGGKSAMGGAAFGNGARGVGPGGYGPGNFNPSFAPGNVAPVAGMGGMSSGAGSASFASYSGAGGHGGISSSQFLGSGAGLGIFVPGGGPPIGAGGSAGAAGGAGGAGANAMSQNLASLNSERASLNAAGMGSNSGMPPLGDPRNPNTNMLGADGRLSNPAEEQAKQAMMAQMLTQNEQQNQQQQTEKEKLMSEALTKAQNEQSLQNLQSLQTLQPSIGGPPLSAQPGNDILLTNLSDTGTFNGMPSGLGPNSGFDGPGPFTPPPPLSVPELPAIPAGQPGLNAPSLAWAKDASSSMPDMSNITLVGNGLNAPVSIDPQATLGTGDSAGYFNYNQLGTSNAGYDAPATIIPAEQLTSSSLPPEASPTPTYEYARDAGTYEVPAAAQNVVYDNEVGNWVTPAVQYAEPQPAPQVYQQVQADPYAQQQANSNNQDVWVDQPAQRAYVNEAPQPQPAEGAAYIVSQPQPVHSPAPPAPPSQPAIVPVPMVAPTSARARLNNILGGAKLIQPPSQPPGQPPANRAPVSPPGSAPVKHTEDLHTQMSRVDKRPGRQLTKAEQIQLLRDSGFNVNDDGEVT